MRIHILLLNCSFVVSLFAYDILMSCYLFSGEGLEHGGPWLCPSPAPCGLRGRWTSGVRGGKTLLSLPALQNQTGTTTAAHSQTAERGHFIIMNHVLNTNYSSVLN